MLHISMMQHSTKTKVFFHHHSKWQYANLVEVLSDYQRSEVWLKMHIEHINVKVVQFCNEQSLCFAGTNVIDSVCVCVDSSFI